MATIAKKEKAAAILDDVQSRAKVRTIDMQDLEAMCDRVESRLRITKAAMHGVSFRADYHAQAFPSAYHGIPESTHVEMVCKRGKWELVKAWRDRTSAPSYAFVLKLTDEAKAAVLRSVEAFDRFGNPARGA